MMKKRILLIAICSLLIITGCSNKTNNDINSSKTNNSQINETKESDEKVSDIKVIINDKEYTLNLDNSKTVEEFIDLLPQEFNMSDLNDNEKYVYMNNSLATNSYYPKHIQKGDVMLYGDNCLVIFYKSFDTNFSYTKIGHIDNLDNLEDGSITVKFEK